MPVPVNPLPKPLRRICTCLTCQRTKAPKPPPTPNKLQGPQRSRTTAVKTQIEAKTPANPPRVNVGFNSNVKVEARPKINPARRSLRFPVTSKPPVQNESPWKTVFCCPVCSREIQEAFKFRILLTECGHRFCSSCLYRAHLSHPVCPTCKRPVDKYNFKRGFD